MKTPLFASVNAYRLSLNGNTAFAQNDIAPTNEWAGACYSPDGQWLFVNIQSPGITFAITGPWGSGPL
jgi:secreted PhoX family phosphatase